MGDDAWRRVAVPGRPQVDRLRPRERRSRRPRRPLPRAVDADWGQLYAFLPDEPWVREAHPSPRPFLAHANWLELGWAVRGGFRGRGYATEIGRAGLEFAFDVLGVQAVVSIAIRHNRSSRAVMERLGLRPVGEIRTRGLVEGVDGVQPDAPYAACVLLKEEWNRV